MFLYIKKKLWVRKTVVWKEHQLWCLRPISKFQVMFGMLSHTYLLYLVQITHLLRFTDVCLYPACVAVCEKHFHYTEKKTQCTNTNKVIKFSFRRYNTLMTYKRSFWLSNNKMNPHFWTANYTKATTEKELSLHFLCRSLFFCSNSSTIYLLRCMSL